jgi:RNA 2',3'-cyclic 3'-phosphodiesterase
MHLTLHFLGEMVSQDIDAVRNALAGIKFNAFEVGLKGIGKFPPDGEPKVLWAGVEANADLFALHRAVGDALTDAIGYRREERPYSPHVSLARINEAISSDAIDGYMQRNRRLVVSAVPIDRFALYSSKGADNLPRYQEEAVFSQLGHE